MRIILQVVSWGALVATLAAPLLFLMSRITLDQTKSSMLAATIAWFTTAPLWMGRPKVEEELVV